ncbi:alpha/beta fold hydrolase [Nocardia sp. NPDC020380]|uniref:alpha/beta fold hydrolase n=1 Tax=Nocardia sp. NPDC020380 TaxID=3364309 RepID=UPI0037964E32
MTSSDVRAISVSGNEVGVAEYGDRSGRPVLYCHGIPGSHIEAVAFDQAAVTLGMRVIAVDRAGMGASAPVFPRRVLDWADTVAALADSLGLGRFGIIGVSGGGPYALACAAALPERVTTAVLVSAPAPLDELSATGELDDAAKKRHRGLSMLRRFPILARPAAAQMAAYARKPGGVEGLIAQMSPLDRERVLSDPELTAKLEANLREAFRQGSRGFALDLQILVARPWGFRLADITVPIRIWHGDADQNVPLSDGRHLAAALPTSRLEIVSGAGHLLFVDRAADILQSISDDQTD